eukprot:g11104.t1
MGVTDDDKPWAHPDPPAAESWGFRGGGGGNGGYDGESEAMREGRLRTNLFFMVVSIIVFIWVYRKFVKRDRTPFFYVPPTPTEEATVSAEDMRIAREARLKRFQETKTSYADMMKEAAGGWTPGDGGGDGGGGGGAMVAGGEDPSAGLRRRGI